MSRSASKEGISTASVSSQPAAQPATQTTKPVYLNDVYLGKKGDGTDPRTPKGQYSNMQYDPERNCVTIRFPIADKNSANPRWVSTDVKSLSDIITQRKPRDGEVTKMPYSEEHAKSHRNIRLGDPSADVTVYGYENGKRFEERMTNAELAKCYADNKSNYQKAKTAEKEAVAAVEAPAPAAPTESACDLCW